RQSCAPRSRALRPPPRAFLPPRSSPASSPLFCAASRSQADEEANHAPCRRSSRAACPPRPRCPHCALVGPSDEAIHITFILHLRAVPLRMYAGWCRSFARGTIGARPRLRPLAGRGRCSASVMGVLGVLRACRGGFCVPLLSLHRFLHLPPSSLPPPTHILRGTMGARRRLRRHAC
ncbi:hypothetical protein C8J57DRAFT_1312710, partial [Mycena rebaudengoi]